MGQPLLLGVIVVAGVLGAANPSSAQGVVRDDTLGAARGQPVGSVLGPDGRIEYQITPDLGTQTPGSPNLFHSFERLDLAANEVAVFYGAESIANIIARVTGGSASSIDGTIRVPDPDTNFYLLNPAGILFGQNALLDVTGSFYASTATQLRLQDGSTLDTRAGGTVPLLSTAAPEDFGFLNPTGRIEVRGSEFRTLGTPRGTLGLAATEVIIENVGLGSTDLDGDSSYVRISGTERISASRAIFYGLDGFELAAPTIELTSTLLVGTRGAGRVTGRELRLTNFSATGRSISLDADELIARDGGTILASEAAEIVGNRVSFYNFSLSSPGKVHVIGRDELLIQGRGFESVFEADELTLEGAKIWLNQQAEIYSPALLVKAGSLLVEDSIIGIRFGTSEARNARFTLEAKEGITLRGEGGLLAASSDPSHKQATINVSTPRLLIENGASISAGTSSDSAFGFPKRPTADGGIISILADEVALRTGGRIDTSSIGEGDSGSIDITAKRSISVSGAGSGIFAVTGLNGAAGFISLRAPEVSIGTGARVSSETSTDRDFLLGLGRRTADDVILGRGNAGSVSIEGETITVSGGASVSSASSGSGNGGSVSFTASNSIRISEGSEVTARSIGTGNAGSVTLRAGNEVIVSDSVVATSSAEGSGGDIVLEAKFVGIEGSEVRTDVGTGDGGNLDIIAKGLLVTNSELIARSRRGSGGRIRIDALQFLRDTSSKIDASSDVGIDGEVDFQSSADLNSTLNVLTSRYVDPASLLVERCELRDREEVGSFRIGGREGLPETPQQRSGARWSRVAEPADAADRGDLDAFLLAAPLADAPAAPVERLIRSAEVLEALGELARARDVLALADERADKLDRVRIQALRGRLWGRSGVWSNADRDLAAAERAAEALGDAGLLARARLDRGNSEADQGRLEVAHNLYARALESAERAQDADTHARARAALATDVAGLEAAVAELTALPGSHDRLMARIHVGLAFAALPGDAPRVRAGEVLALAAEHAQDIDDLTAASYAWGHLAELYAGEGRNDEAIELLRRALFVAAATDRHEAVYRWGGLLGRALRTRDNLPAAAQSYRLALEAVENIRSSATLSPRSMAQLAAAFPGQSLARELVDVLLTQASRAEGRDTRTRLLLAARSRLEASSRREIRDYFQDECLALEKVTPVDSMPDALVVYPVLLGDRVELLVSGSHGIDRVQIPAPANEVRDAIQSMRLLVEDRTTHAYRRPAAQLYAWLIEPLAPFLSAGPADRTLVFVPSGAFASLPFAALYDRKRDQFLVQQHALAISPGLSLIEPRALELRDEGRLVLQAALTQAVADYPALASAGVEVDAIAQLLGGKMLRDSGFVASALDHELATAPYEIVHIASHAQFGEDADSTYLLTYDGRIGMSELGDLIGRTRFRDKPLELLTLSACQTAAGGERAALGLAGVAVRAGARSTLASLWSVNDPATARLMRGFYQHLVQDNVSRARALELAQRELLADPIYRHPAYWSPFVLVGSWR